FNSIDPVIKPPSSLNPMPVMPQYDPTKGSIFSNVPYVTLFINTFLQAVCKTDILREVFDISQTTAKQKGDFVRWYTEKVLREIDVENAAAIGEFAARAIAPNFDVLTRSIVAPAYSHMAANFLFVDGFLGMDNAKDLGLILAQSMVDSAIENMNSDPTSKFLALADGFVNFFRSLGLFTKTKAPLLGYYVGNEWFVAAVNYKQITRDVCERNMF
ncbi:hypothetical protein AVEN_152509-1, partial [Araneus ventricosus]